MGIRVRHDPPIAGPGELAVQVGLGARRDKNRQFSQQDRQLDLHQQSIDTQMRAIDAQMQANRDRISSQQALQESAQQHQGEMAQASHDQYRDRMSFQDELTKGRIEFEYTQQQQNAMEKYSQGLAFVQQKAASGEWTQEQAEDAFRQIEAQLIGIQPVPKFNPENLTPQQQWEEGTFTNDHGVWIKDRSGSWRLEVPNAPKPSEMPQVDAKTFFNGYQNFLAENGGDHDQAYRDTVSMMDAFKRYAVPQAHPGPPPTANYGFTDPAVDPGVPDYVREMTALNAFDQYNQMASGHHNPQQGNPQAGPQPEPVPQGPGQQLTQTGTNSWEIHDADKKPLGINADHKEQARVWGEHYKLSDDETALIAMRLAEGVNPRDILKVLMKNAK